MTTGSAGLAEETSAGPRMVTLRTSRRDGALAQTETKCEGPPEGLGRGVHERANKRSTGENAPAPELDVLVIGAGQAGLATAYQLQATGLRYLVVDGHP